MSHRLHLHPIDLARAGRWCLELADERHLSAKDRQTLDLLEAVLLAHAGELAAFAQRRARGVKPRAPRAGRCRAAPSAGDRG